MSDWRDPTEEDYKLQSRKGFSGEKYRKDKRLFNYKIASIFILSIVTLLLGTILNFSNFLTFTNEHNIDETKKPEDSIVVSPPQENVDSQFPTNIKSQDIRLKNVNTDIMLIVLENFLRNEDFQSADTVTRTILYNLMGTSERYLSQDDFSNLDCYYINYIDGLWESYSNGKFSFSKQNKIYTDIIEQSFNGFMSTEGNIAFGRAVGWFNDEVEGGWINNSNLDYSTNAPDGHLPTRTPVSEKLDLRNAWLFVAIYTSSLPNKCQFSEEGK